MRVVFDIEANGLNPTHIWCIVCQDIDTGELHIFREPGEDNEAHQAFRRFAMAVSLWVGHNALGYDVLHIRRLLDLDILPDLVCDTLVVSKLVNYSRKGHSLDDFGIELGLQKNSFSDFTKYSPELEARCIQDVAINKAVYLKFLNVTGGAKWARAIKTEQDFQWKVINALQANGFYFNKDKGEKLLAKVTKEKETLDVDILSAFPPRQVVVREFTPKATKFGTISKTSVPRTLWDRLSQYEIGVTYQQTREEEFNPSSHKQLIQVLTEAGWKPTDKTTTHIQTVRDLAHLRYGKQTLSQLDLANQKSILETKLDQLQTTGWKINETNLLTLPPSAPAPARSLAKRIMLESRRRTLTEWLSLVQPDNRIHGKFYGLGAWTHRMAHQNPNTANIPTDVKLYGGEMRSLWCVPRNRLLVGVDAEGIQLRIFAHYINDPEFTKALVEGKKDDKSDPHSLNQRILGAKSRAIAKRFIFAYLLGGAIGKLSEILEVDETSGRRSLERLLHRYQGLAYLKDTIIPRDARRGYFEGVDGREVPIPGDTAGERRHLCMSGYLQNGEAVVMKMACLKWIDQLEEFWAFLVNFVHDEWQTECPNNMEVALKIAKIQADSLRIVGEELGLKCPLAGSYWSDDLKDYTIGVNWKRTH